MTRGVPSIEQVSLSTSLDGILNGNFQTDDGKGGLIDVRNYGGGVLGIPAARRLMGEIMRVPSDEVMVYGNSSLELMSAYLRFFRDTKINPVLKETPKFIILTPGYDRHCAVCEDLGFEMIGVPLTPDGPDMDLIENLVKNDPAIVGMFIVPKYSNPTGHVFSENSMERIAKLPLLDPDRPFLIMNDDAYSVHDLFGYQAQTPLRDHGAKHGTHVHIATFASTSKITFAGGGLGAIALSRENLADFEKAMSLRSIGPDKVNQLRHTRLLPDFDSVLKHMSKHSVILRPKFEKVLAELQAGLGENPSASWLKPEGGYFITLEVPGLAKRVEELCKQAGVTLTPAGATYPDGIDPKDSTLRIAPSFPRLEQLELATRILVASVRIAQFEEDARR